MICYKCNRRVGTQWVKFCPYCGNEQIQAENIEARAKIERIFDDTDKPDDARAESAKP